MFLGFIFAIFGIEYARRKYLETKNENEGFSKATEDAKFYGQITLFIILLVIFYAGAALFGSGLASAGGGAPDAAILLPIIGSLVMGPFIIAYYLAFVLIK
jgi:hypothetical protein